MTAQVISLFKNKSASLQKIESTEEIISLELPSREDVAGFISVLNFLAQSSDSNMVELSIMPDELNVRVKHMDDLYAGEEITAATAYEVFANMPFNPESTDKEKTINNALVLLDRLDIDKYNSDK